LEIQVAPNFRVEKEAKQETSTKKASGNAEKHGVRSKPEAFCGTATALLKADSDCHS
jgi:hypothetical protein